MNQQKMTTLVKALYQAVDNKDIDYLNDNLTKNARFRLGNFPEVIGKKDILEGNRQFFQSIESMSHTIKDIVFEVLDDSATSKACCHGTVDYVRLDGSEHSATFSTFLIFENMLIIDYLVFADLSAL